MDEALDHFPKIELNPLLAERVINGQTLRVNQSVQPQQLYRVYNEKLQFFALCEGVGPSHIKPKKVFK
jgi:tRNA U55 pseudouridine synthase TruB